MNVTLPCAWKRTIWDISGRLACSDYPHTEGTDTALEDYRRAGMEPPSDPAFFAGNVNFLLRA